MQLVKQLHRHAPADGIYGDCFRTAVACILECDPAELPHEHRAVTGAEQNALIDAWLSARGLTLLSVPFAASDLDEALRTCAFWSRGLPFLLIGRSRNDANHVVIGRGAQIIHDPAQDDSGIVGPADNGYFWCEWLVRSAEGTGATRGGPEPVALTRRQREALDFILAYRAENGVSPTYREIMNALGVAGISHVSRLVYALRDRGHIRLLPNHHRSILPLDERPTAA